MKVTRVVVSREPEWDEHGAAEAEALQLIDEYRCPGCGGHLPQTMRVDIGRDVEESDGACQDCEAIKVRMSQIHHTSPKHKGDERDCTACHETHLYVADYIPLPPT